MSRTCAEELDNRKALVLGLIYERTGRGMRSARLSYREIAQYAGCSQGCAINCMRRLVKEGLISKRPYFDADGGQRGNSYVLLLQPTHTGRTSDLGTRKSNRTADGAVE